MSILKNDKHSLRSFIRKYANFLKNEKLKLQKKNKGLYSTYKVNESLLKLMYEI